MFRPMRRARQQLSQAETEQILTHAATGILAVQGDDGYPYPVPLNFVYTDGKIFFHCAKAGHKIDAIRACDKVSFCVIEQDTIVAEELTTYFRSVIAFGRARILTDETQITAAARALGMKYYPNAEAVDKEISSSMRALCCVEITPEHITGKQAIELTRAGNRPDN